MKINTVKDPNNLTELEQKHVPIIKMPDAVAAGEKFEVKVIVGGVVHPMQEDHYIQWIELFWGENSLGRVDLKPADQPEATFSVVVKESGELHAREECNLHGIWESSKSVQV